MAKYIKESKSNMVFQYSIYFHDILETTPEIGDNEKPTGEQILIECDYYRFINPDLKIRFLKGEEYVYKEQNGLIERHFECWLRFNAKNDQDAISKIDKILKKNDFEHIDVYYVLEGERENNMRIVFSKGIGGDK